jgi:diadenosine tetraphosphate (Ap4A) HIT family hydrolase
MSCELCDFLAKVEAGDDPFAVARLRTGYVKLHPTQYFRGYTLFTATRCVPEIYDLPPYERTAHLHEMAEVVHAVARAFQPRKMNYEALGNAGAHLHWHVFPRYDDDPHPRGPVWEDLAFLRQLWLGEGVPEPGERDARRSAILQELRTADVEIEHAYL